MALVEDIFVYPVKSARGIACESVRLVATGSEWDRHWLVVDATGAFLTQRTHPQLARVVPEIANTALVLRAPGLSPLSVPLAAAGEQVTVRIWNDVCEALDLGEEVASWMSEAIGDAVRLVRKPEDMRRTASRKYTGEVVAPVAFPDGYPVRSEERR